MPNDLTTDSSWKRDPPSTPLFLDRVVLHIYGQIAIWLSLFAMTLAIVLFAIGKR